MTPSTRAQLYIASLSTSAHCRRRRSSNHSCARVTVPLETFGEYGRYFQKHVVPDLDRREIAPITRRSKSLLVEPRPTKVPKKQCQASGKILISCDKKLQTQLLAVIGINWKLEPAGVLFSLPARSSRTPRPQADN